MKFWSRQGTVRAMAESFESLGEDDAYFPPSSDRTALRTRAGDLAEWAAVHLSDGPSGSPAAVLLSPKRGWNKYRPVWLLHPLQAMALNATGRALAENMPDGLLWHEYSKATQGASEEAWVVSFDIANYYEYIDHALLASSLVNRTGSFVEGASLQKLLGEIAGRSFGLPQVQRPAIPLADMYAQYLEEPLKRDFETVIRFSDDFNVLVADAEQAAEAMAAAHLLARKVGLAINEQKANVFAPGAYTEATNREKSKSRALLRLAQHESGEADEWAVDIGPYGGDGPVDLIRRKQSRNSQRILAFLATDDQAFKFSPRHITGAFFLGTNLGDGEYDADVALAMIDRFPWLTMFVIRDMGRHDHLGDDLMHVAERALSKAPGTVTLSLEWSLCWLFATLRDATEMSRAVTDKLERHAGALQSSVARAFAMDALSAHDRGDGLAWLRELDHVHPSVRTTVLHAAARRVGRNKASSYATTFLERAVVDLATD